MAIPGFIHIDLDGSWTILKHLGHPWDAKLEKDIVFDTGLPRIVEFLDKYRIKGTFFCIGHDLEHPKRSEALYQLAAKGHELANHTYSHVEGFGLLTREQQRTEIDKTDLLLREVSGNKPIGFRAPNYEIDEGILQMLIQSGYVYDSSVLPSTVIVPFRMAHYLSSEKKTSSLYLGNPHNWSAPRTPYHPCMTKIYTRGLTPILEFPVSVTPFLRFPVHLSYLRLYSLVKLARWIFKRTLLWYVKQHIPFLFLLHLSDLADPDREKPIRNQIGNSLSVAQRMALLDECLLLIRSHTHISTMRDFIEM